MCSGSMSGIRTTRTIAKNERIFQPRVLGPLAMIFNPWKGESVDHAAQINFDIGDHLGIIEA